MHFGSGSLLQKGGCFGKICIFYDAGVCSDYDLGDYENVRVFLGLVMKKLLIIAFLISCLFCRDISSLDRAGWRYKKVVVKILEYLVEESHKDFLSQATMAIDLEEQLMFAGRLEVRMAISAIIQEEFGE